MSLENTPAARISALAAAQKTYFRSGATLSEAFRRTMLRRLDAALANWEKRLCDALWTDLHKSPRRLTSPKSASSGAKSAATCATSANGCVPNAVRRR